MVPIIITLMPERGESPSTVGGIAGSVACDGLSAAQVTHMQSTLLMLNATSRCTVLNVTLGEIMMGV